MIAMDPQLKLTLLFSALFFGSAFLAVLVVMNSVANMANHLEHLHAIIGKEVILRYNYQVNQLKQQKQRSLAENDRDRRQEALLAIPLVRNAPGKSKK